jgi:hypothetical protein
LLAVEVIKPWQLLVFSACCLLPLAAVTAGVVWLVVRRRR